MTVYAVALSRGGSPKTTTAAEIITGPGGHFEGDQR